MKLDFGPMKLHEANALKGDLFTSGTVSVSDDEEYNETKYFYYNEFRKGETYTYDEDCLFLNIWTPEKAENCPVLVYIHGGSFVKGSNSDPAIDGEAYTRRGIIMVSINYRLGPFASPYGDGYTGNLALTDQLTALRWIRDNIEDYGGDPQAITVMGESAGAISVQNLLISPWLRRGLSREPSCSAAAVP